MMRYIAIAGLVGCIALGGSLAWVKGQRDDALASVVHLRAELATAKMQRDQARDAAAVHKAWLDRAAAADAAASDRESEFQNRDGGDEVLSDFLRDALDRVR